MKRYKKFVCEAEKGITFDISEGTSGELIIRALNIAITNIDSESNEISSVSEENKYVCKESSTATNKVDFENDVKEPILKKDMHVCKESSIATNKVDSENDVKEPILKKDMHVSKERDNITNKVDSENDVKEPILTKDMHVGQELKNARNKVAIQTYAKPPILKGYKHIRGKWNNGFVIERRFDKSQLVWIPVGSLDSNGTLNGVSFTKKFGKRNYKNSTFSEDFGENSTYEFALQVKSVKKYGGFYLSCYNISKNEKTGKPQSVKGAMPWVNINYHDAKAVASTFENNETIKSHLVFGAEYDSVLEWLIKTGVITRYEIEEDSSKWGNYWNTENSPQRVVKTGIREEWCANNIYDLAGNVDEWTQEQSGSSYRIIRGASAYYSSESGISTVAARTEWNTNYQVDYTGFRTALCIK